MVLERLSDGIRCPWGQGCAREQCANCCKQYDSTAENDIHVSRSWAMLPDAFQRRLSVVIDLDLSSVGDPTGIDGDTLKDAIFGETLGVRLDAAFGVRSVLGEADGWAGGVWCGRTLQRIAVSSC